jgi:hypothetical protein
LTTNAQGGSLPPAIPGFGERVKEALVAVFGSVPRAAVAIDTDRSALYRWTKEERFPDFEQLGKLADAGISVDRLLTGKGPVLMVGSGDERYAAGRRAGLEEARGSIPTPAVPARLTGLRMVAEAPIRPATGDGSVAERIDEIRQVVARPSDESARPASPQKREKKARRGRP